MPRKNQVLIGFKCDPEFRAKVERAAGDEPLSLFVRKALVEKLESLGIRVNPRLAEAPSRLGKGGPKKKTVAFQKMGTMEQTLRAAEEPPR